MVVPPVDPKQEGLNVDSEWYIKKVDKTPKQDVKTAEVKKPTKPQWSNTGSATVGRFIPNGLQELSLNRKLIQAKQKLAEAEIVNYSVLGSDYPKQAVDKYVERLANDFLRHCRFGYIQEMNTELKNLPKDIQLKVLKKMLEKIKQMPLLGQYYLKDFLKLIAQNKCSLH